MIAIVDGDPAIRQLLHDMLTEEGYQTILLVEAAPVIDVIGQTRPDLIILDLWSGSSGECRGIARRNNDPISTVRCW